jgi:hypothetical protein
VRRKSRQSFVAFIIRSRVVEVSGRTDYRPLSEQVHQKSVLSKTEVDQRRINYGGPFLKTPIQSRGSFSAPNATSSKEEEEEETTTAAKLYNCKYGDPTAK